MSFRPIKTCGRSADEQRYIRATMEIWRRLPLTRQEETLELIGAISGTAEEGRALYDVVVRGRPPQTVSSRTCVQLRRIYAMRREFYDRFPIR